MKDLKVNLTLGATNDDMLITYVGPSSSGRMHQYSVSEKLRKELEKKGVVFSAHRENSFYSPTRIYLATERGATFEHPVECFETDGRKVNFFPNLDKDKQKKFVQDLRNKERIAMMKAATNENLSELALYKAELMELQIRKLQREIANMNNMMEDPTGMAE